VDTFEETAGPFAGVQNVRTPVSSMNTLYPQVGDIFGNVMLLGLAGLFIGLIFTRKK
jgi:hypothetical protein